jgi:long-chain acyl-CoA synthetase
MLDTSSLTDFAIFMIIFSALNIYPKEAEGLLITDTRVADAAVFGVPNADLGEKVKASFNQCPVSWRCLRRARTDRLLS